MAAWQKPVHSQAESRGQISGRQRWSSLRSLYLFPQVQTGLFMNGMPNEPARMVFQTGSDAEIRAYRHFLLFSVSLFLFDLYDIRDLYDLCPGKMCYTLFF